MMRSGLRNLVSENLSIKVIDPLMTDEIFIKAILQNGQEAKEKVNLGFSNISLEQLNWKPSPQSWSLAQCLHHLIVAGSSLFSCFKKNRRGNIQNE